MNFFNTIKRTQYFSVYHDQNSFKELRQKKSNSNRVFDTKIIID